MLGGEYLQFQLPAGTTPKIIVTGPDGNLWFASNARDDSSIMRATPTGTIAECPLPTAESWPYGIAVGPDRNLWFTESGSGKIGRLTP